RHYQVQAAVRRDRRCGRGSNVDYVLERGPLTLESECDLLRKHDIDVIVAKNSGGAATYAKIEAACLLGIEVIMVARASASIVK
ncbi:precorrin-6A/cobalt-precorrin-6A reductase, partial [Rhizobium leguminosarum]|uniref:precorrin-6A/cobalt-precorrin-6A reductase n=1 Tax=Rhizobium leguminosarum TaxID=384 RepID=UPI003F965E57